ncbi:hypothetical protein EYF80_006310 [Liparis tanakae]|uniref:Uncharacterized protein n=1 Tax=Liparis tanakae TaxID=230148 RepID=A0A4Z2IZB1_9TELE|nr:hypothetical protein EYF80_006310 [Liparis tanakae]
MLGSLPAFNISAPRTRNFATSAETMRTTDSEKTMPISRTIHETGGEGEVIRKAEDPHEA